MSIDGWSIQLVVNFMDGTTVAFPSPGVAVTGNLVEGHLGLPMRIPGGTNGLNVKLGTLTNPAWIAVYGEEGISIEVEENGTGMAANPFLFLSDTIAKMAVSEVWVSNSDNEEHAVTILAAES